MSSFWSGGSAEFENVTDPDGGLVDGEQEATYGQVVFSGQSVLRVLLWWEVDWWCRAGSGLGPARPPRLRFELSVKDIMPGTGESVDESVIGQGLMAAGPTPNVSFSDTNPFFDGFRQHHGDSGGQPIDLRGTRLVRGVGGEGQLHLRVTQFSSPGHDVGLAAGGFLALAIHTSVLIGPSLI